jgi:hypothetical protein
MNIEEINDRTRYYACEQWDLDYPPFVIINRRLTRSLARYNIGKNIIEIAPITSYQNKYIITDILLHELCHWYCNKTGLNDHDFSRDFERELDKVESYSSKMTCVDNGVILYYQPIETTKKNDIEISICGLSEYIPTTNVKKLSDTYEKQ